MSDATIPLSNITTHTASSAAIDVAVTTSASPIADSAAGVPDPSSADVKDTTNAIDTPDEAVTINVVASNAKSDQFDHASNPITNIPEDDDMTEIPLSPPAPLAPHAHYAASLAGSASSWTTGSTWSLFSRTSAEPGGLVPIVLPSPGSSQMTRLLSLSPRAQSRQLAYYGYSPADVSYWLLAAELADRGRFTITGIVSDRNLATPSSLPYILYNEQQGSGLVVIAKMTRAINGTWEGRAAIYVGLCIIHQGRQVEGTTVTVRVKTGGLGDMMVDEYFADQGANTPKIVRHAPARHYSDRSTSEQTQEVSGSSLGATYRQNSTRSIITGREVSVYVAPIVAGPMTNLPLEMSSNPSRVTQATMSTSGDSLVLHAKQNPKTKNGISEKMPIGLVVLTRDKPILILVDVRPKVGITDQILGFVGNSRLASYAAILDDRTRGGQDIPPNLPKEIDQWDEQVWKKLVSYPEDHESVLVSS